MANKILVARGMKARLETIKSTLATNELVYSTNTSELGVKKANGEIEYFMNATDINARLDPNAMAYFDYAGSVYGDKYSLLPNAWEHSLTVDPLEISVDGTYLNPRGKAQYPNGETEGVIIPQGVTSIGSYAFCDLLTNNQPLVIPNSVTSIGYAAFANWRANNQPLVILNNVTSIGDNAFRDWRANNQPLVIPNNVTSIGNNAFRDWSLVPYVEMQAITPPTLANANAFDGQNDAPIYVPDASVTAYKAEPNWVGLADRIFPISDMTGDSVLSDRIDNLEISKQDKLVAGDNITIDENTNVISASGVESYNDLTDKPTIPDTSGLLPKSGGTLENYNEKITTLSASSGAINLSLGNVFVQTPSANITYAITNAVSGVAHSFTLIVNMGATVRTLTFPASVKWQGGEIPDMTTASKTYILTFLTVNGGTTWLGMFGGEF